MRTFNIILACLFILSLTACSKDDASAPLSEGSISFQQAAGKDTIEIPLGILKDSAIVTGIKAALSGTASSADHWVTFAVDTTKITDYRTRYGSTAQLVPLTSYLFYKPNARIAAGAVVSDSAYLNVGSQTKLAELSTYVLPIVIKSVDGKVEGVATSRVVYLVFKTGKGFISKAGWTIAGSSSQNGSLSPGLIIDADNLATYWASNITQAMPQWVSINFNRDVTFTAMNYYFPTALKYPTMGGYPTSIQIETSMDGITWVNKGVYAGNIVSNIQTLNTGLTTARYLRFTSLAVAKFISGASQSDAVFIGGIALFPVL
jgi:hypothetical protein